MSDLSILEGIGFSKDEILDKVVDKIADYLLQKYAVDDNGNLCHIGQSYFFNTLNEYVKQKIDERVEQLAAEYALPYIHTFMNEVVLQETNKWGEKKGQKMTFIEYLVERAENYLTEQVDYQGKSKAESGYGFSAKQTRVSYLIHEYLHNAIERSMKEAVTEANKILSDGLNKTVKLKLDEITKKIRVDVKV